METITFQCSACKFTMKVGADKAGRKGKCSKCGAQITVPNHTPPGPPPAAKKTAADYDDDDEDGKIAFTIRDDPNPQEEARKIQDTKTKVTKGPGRIAAKKLALITDGDAWRKVGSGCVVIAGGLALWLASYILYRIPMIVGMAVGEEYAIAAEDRLIANAGDIGKPPDLDITSFAIALISGSSWGTAMIWLVRLSQVLYLLQYIALVAGYLMCLAVPNRFGARFQLYLLMGLACFNGFVCIAFKLLPMFGAYRYVILPFAVPEVVMISMNAERVESLYTFFLRWPAFESYVAILLTTLHYLEPALIATFIHTVGVGTKHILVEEKGSTLMKLGYSQLFAQATWMMACLCGTSIVLMWVLRFVYCVCVFFFIYQMINTIIALLGIPHAVSQQLGDEAGSAAKGLEKDEDEEDDE